jgi:cytoskeletal protein CcmA (bactofilin family)
MAMFDKHKGSKQPSSQPSEPTMAPKAPSMSAPPSAGSTAVAMIGRGISIVGDVSAETDLRIEGLVQGQGIQSSRNVEIGESGQVAADITACVVKIGGEVKGDITGSEKVIITKTGRVQGNVVAPRVVIEDGSLFRGSIEMNPTQAAKPKAAPAESVQPKAEPVPTKAAVAGGASKEPGLTLKSG